ncbi:hypothetical protein [Nitrosospira sp. NpAV]|uniref:hypothetical protein n=1 Tax=Nitrosospira sp. NpAV TaxID=58133 RepID=UPI0005A148C4|nr:hypothetical protein [Nitrosospira sp. NpAV]KIO50179.1 hypothetical protein SQ11_00210 [Nitrosospira sp. NpAV]
MKSRIVKVLILASIGFIALPVSAKEGNTGVAGAQIDISCIQNAIDERDTSLANMVNIWSSLAGNALEARRDAEKASWNIPSYKERRFSQRKAWSDYGKSLRAANAEKKKERVRIWKKFDHDRKECEGAYSPEMNTGSTYDANL